MYIMIILYRFLHVMLAYYFNSKGHSSVNYEIRIFILQAFGFVFIRIRKAFPFGHFCWLNVYERISKNHVNDVVSHLYYDLSIIAIFVLLDCRKIMYNIISDGWWLRNLFLNICTFLKPSITSFCSANLPEK